MWTIIAVDPTGKEVARAELTDEPLTVGRGKDCGLVLPSGSVSRKHARIEMRGDKPYLLDEGSANGTMVNGQKVVAPAELDAGSAIAITPFKLKVEGPPDEDEDEKTVMLSRPAMPPSRPAAPPPPPPAAQPPPPPPAAQPPPPPPAAQPPPPPPAAQPPPPPPAKEPTISVGSGLPSQVAWTSPPPVAPKPPPKPADDGPKFLDVPSGGPGAGASPHSAASPGDSDWDSAASELDRQIQSVRSYREQSSDVTQSRVQQIDGDWQKLVTNLQTVKGRLAGNPRLLVFNFARDNSEVTIKLEDKRQRLGYRYFLISRHHPENKFPGKDSVWLRETGREDMDFRDAKAAQSELLQRIAATLA